MEARRNVTASQQKDAEGVKDCFYGLFGLGFGKDKGIRLVSELPGALKNDPIVTGTAAYHIWDSGTELIPRIISKVGFDTLRRKEFVKFAAALKEHGILLYEGCMSTWVKKAQLLSLKALCQEVLKQNPSLVPGGLTTYGKRMVSPPPKVFGPWRTCNIRQQNGQPAYVPKSITA